MMQHIFKASLEASSLAHVCGIYPSDPDMRVAFRLVGVQVINLKRIWSMNGRRNVRPPHEMSCFRKNGGSLALRRAFVSIILDPSTLCVGRDETGTYGYSGAVLCSVNN